MYASSKKNTQTYMKNQISLQFEIIHYSQDIRNWKSNLGVESWLFFNDSRLLTPKNPQTPDSDSQAHLTTANRDVCYFLKHHVLTRGPPEKLPFYVL